MTAFARAARSAAAATLVASAVAAPAAALDVLEGLGPADFQVGGLAPAEARALEGVVLLDPSDWLPAANAEARSAGGTTLGDLGVPTVAAEVAPSDDSLGAALGEPSVADVRLLSTPELRETLGDALGGAGVDLGSLEEALDDLAGDGGVLDDVLDGGLLEDVTLDELPVEDVLDLLDDPDGLLGGLTGGLLGLRTTP